MSMSEIIKMMETMIADYATCLECKNQEAIYGTCHKCGSCGRRFNKRGFMVDDGGTTEREEEE